MTPLNVRVLSSDPAAGGGGVPAGLVFASSWNTAPGNSLAAIRDTGRARPWTGSSMHGGSPVVVSSGGAFPTTNALRLVWSAGNLFIAGSAGYIPIPGVGEYVTHRCFWMMLSGGGFIPAINTGYETSATGPFGAQWFPSGLSQNVPYELQIRLRVTGTLQWQIDAAIFSNPAGARTLIRTTANFLDWGSAPNPLEGYTFTEGAQDQLNRLAGLTVSTEETEQPTHPFYPVFDVTGPAPFPDAPWAWHHEHTNATGNYALLGGVTICAGPTAESEWPLPAWTSAEESWTP